MSEANNEALAVVQQIPPSESAVAQWRRATDIAGLVRAVVLNCTVEIQGRRYLTVAGYQAVANACGYVASARDVVRVEGGWQAVGEVRRLSDGMVISTGVGFLGDDEKMWQSRPTFSKIAMTQTRACGRALRAACGFMAPIIDGKLETTPAEEMELVDRGTTTPPAPAGARPRSTADLKAAMRPSPPQSVGAAAQRAAEQPPAHTDADFRPDPQPVAPRQSAESSGAKATHDRSVSFRFGKSAGVALHSLSEGDLKFYEKCLQNDLASTDDAKRRYAAANTLALSNVQAEMRFRGL